MRRVRWIWLLGALAAAVVLVYFGVFRPDEARARGTLDRIARLMSLGPYERRAQLQTELQLLVTDDVVVQLDGVRLRGRDQVSRLAGDGDFMTVELASPQLSLDGRHASVRGECTVEVHNSDVTRHVRRYEAVLERRDDRWLLKSLDIARATYEEPEARP